VKLALGQRATRHIWGVVSVFVVAVVGLAASLVLESRKTELRNTEIQAIRFVSGAVTAINRNLMGVDVLLASMDDLLGLSGATLAWIDNKGASQSLRDAMRQNLLVRQVLLVDEKENIIASSEANGADLVVNLPAGFVRDTLAQAISTLTISEPAISFNSSEKVLYFARHIRLADGGRVVAMAAMQVPELTTILVQGVDIAGLEATLERSNGLLLASAPVSEALAGKLLSPALTADILREEASDMPARLTGAPALVVARSTIYTDLVISASIPLEAALARWQREAIVIVAFAGIFVLMIGGAGALTLRYLRRVSQAQASLASAKETMDQALESMESGFALLNAEHQILTWNRRFIEIFPHFKVHLKEGLPFETVLNAHALYMLPDESAEAHRKWVKQRMFLLTEQRSSHAQVQPDGRIIDITERATPDGGIVIVYLDVTALRHATAEIEQLAFYDPLTGLPNRRLLTDRLQQAITSSARTGRRGALLFLDLDHFKTLNDTSGHDVGDLLLQQVAQRIKACVRNEDTVARLGGDEFVVMLQGLSIQTPEAAVQAKHVADNILQSLMQPYQLNGIEHQSSCSVGATFFGETLQSSADLLKQADIAMYQVKSAGRNAVCFFDPEMLKAITVRADMERDLRSALQDNQFVLHYQVQVHELLHAVGAEVLVRWEHPVQGLVSPLAFIGLAEDTGLIVPLGEWVLRTACQQLKTWETQAPYEHLELAVNVSARQFRQPDFVQMVQATIGQTGANPKRLKLELTESLVIVNVKDTIEKMQALKAMGVRFSMDDFGTGHSSLTYLTQLPLDQLKIDQSFVRNIGLQNSDRVIISTIIGMAKNLGLEVIAEGVETEAQREHLRTQGCVRYQGYLFSKPLPVAAFEQLLTQISDTALA
jgi:diguanylate cyclase (GGDEF)-like protein